MRFILPVIAFLVISSEALSQKNLDRTLRQLNKGSVPYAYVNELKSTDDIVLLDTRQKVEYEVSHLKGALWVGHKEFNEDSVMARIPDKDTTILVYCSIGVRSEDIGEKLMKAGYVNVKNLYGGIFEWKNQGNTVYNNKATETDSVHTFNQQWGKLLKKGIKVFGAEKK